MSKYLKELSNLIGELAKATERPDGNLGELAARVQPLAIRADICQLMGGRPPLVAVSETDDFGLCTIVTLGPCPERMLAITDDNGDSRVSYDGGEIDRLADMIGLDAPVTPDEVEDFLIDLSLPESLRVLNDLSGNQFQCFILSESLGLHEVHNPASFVEALAFGADAALIAKLLQKVKATLVLNTERISQIHSSGGTDPLAAIARNPDVFRLEPEADEMIVGALARDAAAGGLAARRAGGPSI